MSLSAALITAAAQHATRYLAGDPIPNPGIQTPGGGAAAQVDTLIGIVKWGVLVVIAIVAFVGVGAVAGGKIFTNQRSSHMGVQMLIGDAIAVVLYGSIIGMLSVF